jgi:putative ABC transport system permease protein
MNTIFLQLLKEAGISMKSNKLRSFLTILGILMGVCAVVMMVATGQTVRNEINRELESFGGNKLIISPGLSKKGGLYSRGSKFSIKYSDYNAIKEIKNVKNIAPMFRGNARIIYGSNNWSTSIIGTTTEYSTVENYELESGNMFSEQDVLDGTPYLVIGQTIVEKLFSEGENPVGAVLKVGKKSFTVVGTLKAKGSGAMGMDLDDVMLSPLFAVKRRLTSNKIQDAIHGIEVVADDETTLPYVKGRIEALLQERHGIAEGEENDFEVTNLKEIVDKIDNIGLILSILLTTIASISLLVGSIGIMNMMLVSVTERTREIGIRKTVGAKDRDIMTQFLLESVLISAVGSFIGMALGIVLSQVAGAIFDKSVPISVSTIVVSAIIAVAVGIVSGIVPALRATKLDPTEALRYQ